jgi:DNA replication and repair protein RecF
LAEMGIIKVQKHLSPFPLLDDVFEKLDEERITNLLSRVVADDETQVFITDTNCKRLSAQLENMGLTFQMINV